LHDRIEHIAAMAGGDVEHVHRDGQHFSLERCHGDADQLFQMQLALADAAPADGVEERAVDGCGREAELPARFVLVDVVERRAGIEAGGGPASCLAKTSPGAHADRGAAHAQ
jgi:hypothetical protein